MLLWKTLKNFRFESSPLFKREFLLLTLPFCLQRAATFNRSFMCDSSIKYLSCHILLFSILLYWILTDAHTFSLLFRRIILYLFELSSDDELAGDSNSVINQKIQLEEYAAHHGFNNCVHYTDDGWSGGSFDRPSWKRMMADIEAGKVGCVLAKDMSRIGRDYLQVGYFTDV